MHKRDNLGCDCIELKFKAESNGRQPEFEGLRERLGATPDTDGTGCDVEQDVARNAVFRKARQNARRKRARTTA
ncbi:hypothetical protein CTAYLR_010720 [Chrysophaeum taylorii]|uniref:Uncharacterized protein n=1 Tax=Chrysophaeum taylorii TaxID=2483200 RepID=A0AAD7U5J5_9STRA|nr:hypothetical protein CTAYLR_010720 [Chrysophaeum taylorii]